MTDRASTSSADTDAREVPESDAAALPAPLEAAAVVPYLDGYGYLADSTDHWKVSPGGEAGPQLQLQVTGHTEAGGHTWYTVECSLTVFGSGRMNWSVTRRLSHLREILHNQVKSALGDGYGKFFSDAPFAKHGGLPGTTSRLNTWCAALSACVNSGSAPPTLVANALHFFNAPEPDGEDITL